ncbi:hypothetical protein ACP70R_023004 [Stipagrostis hirtigluma subsp. patula]
MECCRGDLLRRSTGPGDPLPDGEGEEGEDRISALPDDLLLRVLARLRCARAAAHTGLLARRWRGLWARLPELTFHRIAADPLDAALARVARPAPSLLYVDVFYHHTLELARVSSLLRAAAALAPMELVFNAYAGWAAQPCELPCFGFTTSITLKVYRVLFSLPPAGGFPALESLHLEDCDADLNELLPRCPRLRKLWISICHFNSVTINSASLEDLVVFAHFQIRHIEIMAPALKKLYLDAHHGISDEFSLSLSVPALEDLTWKCECRALICNRFGVVWRLWNMELRSCPQPGEHTQMAHVLSLNLETDVLSGDGTRNFEQDISRFLISDFSILELALAPRGHVYGAIVLHLLGLRTSIQKLVVKLDRYLMGEICRSINCPCDKPNNWRSQSISLTDLKEVEIQGFKGEDHEVDLLKVLLRCATVLERVTVRFSGKVSPSDSACMEIQSILKPYPYVECSIYPSYLSIRLWLRTMCKLLKELVNRMLCGEVHSVLEKLLHEFWLCIRAAARLSPATFFLRIWSAFATNSDAIELPSFVRATSIELWASAGRFTLPPAGDFPVLESITLDCSHIEFGDLLPRCFHLRRLCLNSRDLSSITVHSLSLEELDVHSFKQLQRIDIKAPKLKKLRLNADRGISHELSLSLSAPAVEELSWRCSYLCSTGMFGVSRRLEILNFTTERTLGHSQLAGNGGSACLQLQQRSRVHVLWLYILPMPVYIRADATQGFRQRYLDFCLPTILFWS